MGIIPISYQVLGSLMFRQVAEGTALVWSRAVLGDERTAKLLFQQEYDAGFVSRHTHQLAGLLMAHCESYEER